jgi:hypothetical protein
MRHAKMALLVVLGLAGCSDAARLPTGATELPTQDQWLEAHLDSPNATDGAVLLTLAGKDIRAIEGVKGETQVRMLGDSLATILVTGELSPGLVLRVKVPGSARADAYQGSVLQAAEQGTYLQRATSQYGLRVRRAGA